MLKGLLKLDFLRIDEHFSFHGSGDHHLDRDYVARDAYSSVLSRIPHVELNQIWVTVTRPRDIRCGRAIGGNVLAVSTGIFSSEDPLQHRPDFCLQDLSQPDLWLPLPEFL